jgi:hypothetical protein
VSFYYLLNAVLLFAGVIAFILAGFAGTFSLRLQPYRYRIMLGPLGFVILGSLGHSIATGLMEFLARSNHGFSAGAGIVESVLLLLAGATGIIAGIALGSTLDRIPTNEHTYTIANYWSRLRTNPRPPAIPNANSARENVVAISERRKQSGVIRRVSASSENK